MTDVITLTLPREREFTGIADLVVGGLAARHDITVEHLDDLQLAIEGLLQHEEGDGDVTVSLAVGSGELDASVGPLAGAVVSELRRPGDGLGLRRLLDTVVDRVELSDRDGGTWVELHKRFDTAGGEGGRA